MRVTHNSLGDTVWTEGGLYEGRGWQERTTSGEREGVYVETDQAHSGWFKRRVGEVGEES